MAHLHHIEGRPDVAWTAAVDPAQLTFDLPDVRPVTGTKSVTAIGRALASSAGADATIVATDGRAASQGIRAGMTLMQARLRAPGLSIATFDPSRLLPFEAHIMATLGQVSPRLGRGASIDPSADDFFVEIARAHELEALVESARSLDFGPVSVGIADGAFAALATVRMAAMARHPIGAHLRPQVVPPGGDAAFLAKLPVSLLPLGERERASLATVPWRTLGELARLPRAGSVAQWGRRGPWLVGLAGGSPAPVIASPVVGDPRTVVVELVDERADPSAYDHDADGALASALDAAARRLVGVLGDHGLAATELTVVLDGDAPCRWIVQLGHADVGIDALVSSIRQVIGGSLHSRTARSEAADPAVALVVQSARRVRLTATQVRATVRGEPSSDPRPAVAMPLSSVVARLGSRFGSARVVTPVRRDQADPSQGAVFGAATAMTADHWHDGVDRRPAAPSLRDRMRNPPAAVGAVVLSRLPRVDDPWPLSGPSRPGAPRTTRRTVREVSEAVRQGTPGADARGFGFRWITSSDGVRALLAGPEERVAHATDGLDSVHGPWHLVGIAD